jgi:hypothetical protein
MGLEDSSIMKGDIFRNMGFRLFKGVMCIITLDHSEPQHDRRNQGIINNHESTPSQPRCLCHWCNGGPRMAARPPKNFIHDIIGQETFFGNIGGK